MTLVLLLLATAALGGVVLNSALLSDAGGAVAPGDGGLALESVSVVNRTCQQHSATRIEQTPAAERVVLEATIRTDDVSTGVTGSLSTKEGEYDLAVRPVEGNTTGQCAGTVTYRATLEGVLAPGETLVVSHGDTVAYRVEERDGGSVATVRSGPEG